MKIIKNLIIFAVCVFVGSVSFAQETNIDAEIKKIILGRWSVNNNNMCKIVDKSAGVYFADDNGYINRENYNIDKNFQSIKSKISLKISQMCDSIIKDSPVLFNCIYSNKFKKWIPLNII